MKALQHLEIAETVLNDSPGSIPLSDYLDARLRAAELRRVLERDSTPRPIDAVLEELRPLLVQYFTPREPWGVVAMEQPAGPAGLSIEARAYNLEALIAGIYDSPFRQETLDLLVEALLEARGAPPTTTPAADVTQGD